MDNNQNSPNDPLSPPIPSPIQPVPVQSASDQTPSLPWTTPTALTDNPTSTGVGPIPDLSATGAFSATTAPAPTISDMTTSSFVNAPTQPGLDSALSSWQPAPPTSPRGEPDFSQGGPTSYPSAPAPVQAPSPMDTPPSFDSLMANPPGSSLDTPAAIPTFTTDNTAPQMPTQPVSTDINQGAQGASSPMDTTPAPIPTWPPVDQVTPPSQPATLPPFEQSQLTSPPTLPPIEPGPINPTGGSTSLPEPAPTDLSQLTSTSGSLPPVPTESYAPAPEHTNPITTASNTTASTPETVTAPKPFPLQLLIGGVVTLLLVTAASIYIFFFAGKNAPEPSSLPAEQTQLPLSNPPKQVIPSIVPQEATSGAGFGSLNNQLATASAKPLSALDALRQRQASPTP